MAKEEYHNIENQGGEYFTVHRGEEGVVVHVGYSDATLNNKQVDELIRVLKYVKTHGKRE